MTVSVDYIANLVAELNADKAIAEAERIALIEEVDPCDDDLCLWCN
jgi:hypothetical protein